MKTQKISLSNDLRMFDEFGSYNFTSFKGTDGNWHLQSTETNYSDIEVPEIKNISKSILRCLDTFTDKKGNYITRERFKIMQYEKKGLITPLEESRVIVKQYSKKDDKLRRAV